jgi:hypothetical protein
MATAGKDYRKLQGRHIQKIGLQDLLRFTRKQSRGKTRENKVSDTWQQESLPKYDQRGHDKSHTGMSYPG